MGLSGGVILAKTLDFPRIKMRWPCPQPSVPRSLLSVSCGLLGPLRGPLVLAAVEGCGILCEVRPLAVRLLLQAMGVRALLPVEPSPSQIRCRDNDDDDEEDCEHEHEPSRRIPPLRERTELTSPRVVTDPRSPTAKPLESELQIIPPKNCARYVARPGR